MQNFPYVTYVKYLTSVTSEVAPKYSSRKLLGKCFIVPAKSKANDIIQAIGWGLSEGGRRSV